MLARRLSLGGLVALMATSGVLHLVKPAPYVRIVPGWVPAPEAMVFWSGIAEIALAAMLVDRRTRRLGAWGIIALLVAVYPANIQHALDARSGTATWWLTRARLPLQPVMVWWAWRWTRPGSAGSASRQARPHGT